jgi:hypothetical protein
MIKEMYRVTKINSHFVIITWGEPDMRLDLFDSILENCPYEINWKQISLSAFANFINSIRNNSKNTNLTDAVKDKNVLLTSVLDGILLYLLN